MYLTLGKFEIEGSVEEVADLFLYIEKAYKKQQRKKVVRKKKKKEVK